VAKTHTFSVNCPECCCIYGCKDPEALNYDPNATCDDGSCIYEDGIRGCTDPAAVNYNPNAVVNDGSCRYRVRGCTDPNASNYNPNATVNDGSCSYGNNIGGCTDPRAINYNPFATVNNGSCVYSADPNNPNNIFGCTDPSATNYNPNATVSSGSCIYEELPECDVVSAGEFQIPTYEQLKDRYWGNCWGGGAVYGEDADNPPVRGRFSLNVACIRFYYTLVGSNGIISEGQIGPGGARDLRSALDLVFGENSINSNCGLTIYPIKFYHWASNCTDSPLSSLGGAQFAGGVCNRINIYGIDAFSIGC